MKTLLSCLGVLLLLISIANASGDTLVKLTPEEEQKLVAIGDKAAKLVSQRLVKTISADIKAVGIAEAARGWSKSVGIINDTADSFNLGMKIRRPTFQYRNPINKPDAIDQVALNFFQAPESSDAKYFARKVMGENNIRYIYYKPMYVNKKCLLCHSQNMAEDVKAVIKEKYPNDLSGDLRLGAFRAAIRVELPASALK
ncbi:DUF3365 domain-containing protein [Pseudomonadota bacterium]